MSDRTRDGWFDFAALLIGLAGVFNGFQGLNALFKKEYFFESSLVYQNLQVWAWVWLAVGVFQLLTAAALVNGGGRLMGIVAAAGSALVAFASVGADPWRSIIILVADVLVIYHLSVAKGPGARGEALPGPIAPDTQRPPGSAGMR